MRINSGLILYDQRPIVTEAYQEILSLGNPFNCIDILSQYEFDELLIINKVSSLDEKHMRFLGRLAEASALPLCFTGGINKVEQGLELVQLGFERLFINSNNPECMTLCRDLASMVGKQSIGLKIDITSRNGEFYEHGSGRRFQSVLANLLSNENAINSVSEVNINLVDFDGMVQSMITPDEVKEYLKNFSCHKTVTGGVATEDLLERYRQLDFDGCYCLRVHATDMKGLTKLPNDYLVRNRA